MQVGLIGCGQHGAGARARLGAARGVRRPGRRARARARGGGRRARRSPATPRSRERADLVVLCHKPAQLAEVAPRSRRTRSAVASILAATPLAALQGGLPGHARLPLHPLAARRGAPGRGRAGRRPRRRAEGAGGPGSAPRWPTLFAELGTLVVLDDALVDVAMGLMSCAPAYVALVAEAQVDAGVRRGIPAAQGAELVVQTLAGTAELLRRRGYDTRRRPPRGRLAGRADRARPRRARARRLRAAFSDALDAVARRSARAHDPRERPHADRRLPLGADLRLHAADHPATS